MANMTDILKRIADLEKRVATLENRPEKNTDQGISSKKESIKEFILSKKPSNDVQKTHRKWLDKLLADNDLKGITPKVHLVKGNPGSVIPQLAKKQGVDLVVMGTVARTGIEGFFIGNTAEKILRLIDCSVLTVKPKGFKSPVKV